MDIKLSRTSGSKKKVSGNCVTNSFSMVCRACPILKRQMIVCDNSYTILWTYSCDQCESQYESNHDWDSNWPPNNKFMMNLYGEERLDYGVLKWMQAKP